MKVLITGGGGYLGYWLVHELLGRGHSVRVFDRFIFGEEVLGAFAGLGECEIIRGDVRRLQEFPELLQGVEAIAHLAGLSNDPSCELDPEMTIDVNVESTRELARLAVEHGVRRFFFSSSCSVYGHGVFEVLDEKSPPNPVSAYSESKLQSEQDLLALQGDRFEPVIARAATLFGWSRRMRFDLAVNQMVATASRKGVINVLGGGRQWRPFLHVHDAARCYVEFLEAPAEQVSGEIFNVGSDENNLPIIDLAKRVKAHFPDVPLNVAPDDEDTRNYHVRFDKLRSRMGFECKHSIDDGIVEIQAWLQDKSIDPFSEQHFNIQRMKHLLATPVEAGGEPVAPRFVPLARPMLGEEEERAVLEAFRSGWITSGPQIARFEQNFGRTVGAEHVVPVISCTAALHLCLVDAGVGPGDEVITSPITWASTGNTLLNMGAEVVFGDVERDTLNLDPASVEAAITERTKAIMPVHMAGQPCDLEAFYAIGKKHGIPIIEDAAHALGAAYAGTPIGGQGDYACFSFYAIKNITTMEGGAIAVRDAETAKRLRLLASNGMEVTAWDRYGRSAIPSPPEVVAPGYKYLMGNVSAAMGVQQLKRFPEFKTARARMAGMYATALADVDELWLPSVRENVEHAWHLLIVRLRLDRLKHSRNEIAHLLRQENVGTGFHFYGLHLHQYYREHLGMKPEDFPEATAASHEVLSLPLYPGLTDKNIRHVADAVKKVLKFSSR